MAITKINTIHKNQKQSVAQSLKARIDYINNPEKTNGCELVTAYKCDRFRVADHFELAKNLYHQKTGRRRKDEILAYSVIQSFASGEVTPELANKIGYEFALQFTKGDHNFVVATHTDTDNIHNHIIWNATNLDCDRKFKNFYKSYKAIRNLSDLICLKNGLSTIVVPKKWTDLSYDEYLENNGTKTLTHSQKLRNSIDEVLSEKPKSFEEFLTKMEEFGYKVKLGKHIAFKSDEQKRFTRLRSLGDKYTEKFIRSIIDGTEKLIEYSIPKEENKILINKNSEVNLLIDLENALNKKGRGYEIWASKFNIKQLAKTINFLTDNHLMDYEKLTQRAGTVTDNFHHYLKDIKEIEQKMNDISTLQKAIYTFAKTKKIYNEYKKTGYSKKFKEENITEILLYEGAKKTFKELNTDKTLPKVADLKVEYAKLLAEKKKLYSQYNLEKNEHKDILNAKKNIELLLEIDPNKNENDRSKEKNRE